MAAEVSLARLAAMFTTEKYWDNELWRWVTLFLLMLAGLIVGKTLSFIVQRHADRMNTAGHKGVVPALLRSLSGPMTVLLLSGALYMASTFIIMKAPAMKFWLNACQTLALLAVGWFVFRLMDVVEVLLLRWTSKTDTMLDDQLVPLIRKALKLFVAVILGLFIAQNVLNWDIGSILAGLGIGGLAFALAAKDTLANLFGSVTIFSDRPFSLGDRVKIAGHDGFVEEVGFRSTRLRTLMGHQVVIPNATIASEPVENIGRRPYLKRIIDIAVTYDTSPAKLQRGVEIIKEMLADRIGQFPPDTPARVYFSDFAASSLNIQVIYWFTPPDWWQYMAFNHDFNMELLRRFNAEGIDFAFPSQTLYLKNTENPDSDR